MQIVTDVNQISRETQQSWLGQHFAIDVETTGLDIVRDELIGVALYVNGEAYYLVRKHTLDDGETVKSYLSDIELRLLLTPIMTQAVSVAVLHNSKYDLHFFERFGLPLDAKVFDTLIAGKLLNENRQNGLKELAYLVDEEHAKYHLLEEYKTFPKKCPLNVPLAPFAEYAMKDVIVTYKLWELFRKQLAQDEFRGITAQDVFNNVWMPMIPVLREMEARGFRIDVDKARVLHEQYSKIVKETNNEVQREGLRMLVNKYHKGFDIPSLYWKTCRDADAIYINDEGEPCVEQLGIETPVIQPTPRSLPRQLVYNIASSNQLIDLILDDLDLPEGHVPLELTKKGGDSVNVGNLTIIKHYLGDAAPAYIDALLKWRKAEKFLNTYLNMFLEKTDEEGALHGTFSMAATEIGRGGTVTGRLSSSNPNLQQVPSQGEIGREARDLFIARDGFVLIVADYSNMESVMAAHYSKDPVLLDAFANGLDVHALTACGQHNIPYDVFMERYKAGDPQYDAWRRTAKTLLFGQAYGMGGRKLRRELLVKNGQEFSDKEAYALIDSFNDTYQGLYKWKERVVETAGTLGFVTTILGRKRRLPDVWHPDKNRRSYAQRQGVNAIIQGSCADILFQAMPPIQEAFKALGGGLIAAVHDELIGEVPEQYAEVAAKVMQTLMVDLINPRLDCKLKAEAHWGKTWKEAKG